MNLSFHWNQYKYFPYEKDLARRELKTLFAAEPKSISGGLSLNASQSDVTKSVLTTYFSRVECEDGGHLIPQQTLLEASANGGVQETLPGIFSTPILKRQSTRYSSHGLHEYRGKFNPQIVRAIGNTLGLQTGASVLDPFCGSGTTILEAAHIGWNAVGIDINPLGVEIARAKVASIQIDSDVLERSFEKLETILAQKTENLSWDLEFTEAQAIRIGGSHWENRLPNFEYLKNWFVDSALVQISGILLEIAKLESSDVQLIFRIVLSNLLRQVSLQDPSDLRIRRIKTIRENVPVIPLFIRQLQTQIKTILKAKPFVSPTESAQEVVLGDVRRCSEVFLTQKLKSQKFDAVITSPPYASALPYIDTQRLSLATLGLVNSTDIRRKERSLIGNREITNKERYSLEDQIKTNQEQLPESCISTIREMYSSVDSETDGFRKQNVPSLIFQYCRDMRAAFTQIRQVLKKDGKFVLVVGPNRARLGNKDFLIDTPSLLVDLSLQSGFHHCESIELETYQRFDIHKANSIRSETMIVLQA